MAGALLAGGLAACGRPPRPEITLPPARTVLAPAAPIAVAEGLAIHPRDDWGADLPPKGAMPAEDVRYLLVHHTASSNVVPDPRDVIRRTYAWHTSTTKRWNDVAYNFFVAPDGSVWEGRAGSLDGPVMADATGGNQGFSQLVCLLGDFSHVAPTSAAQESLVRLLAHLCVRYGLSTWRDAPATFVSRGSDKLTAGRPVSTPTISGHRDTSYTACPGDRAYALLPEWRRRVHPLVAATWERSGVQPADRLSLEAP